MTHDGAWLSCIVRWCWFGRCLLRNVQVSLCRSMSRADNSLCLGGEVFEFL